MHQVHVSLFHIESSWTRALREHFGRSTPRGQFGQTNAKVLGTHVSSPQSTNNYWSNNSYLKPRVVGI